MPESLLDANIRLRHLTGQPKHFAERVKALLEAADTRGTALVVAPLTLAEVVHVLESTYHWPRAAIAVGRGHGTVISFDRHLGQLPAVSVVYEPAQLRRG